MKLVEVEMIFYIVFINDSPQFILTDKVQAQQKLEELKEEYYQKNKWNFRDRQEYNVSCI